MDDTLIINLIPFEILNQTINIFISKDKVDGLDTIKAKYLNEEGDDLSWDLKKFNNSQMKSISRDDEKNKKTIKRIAYKCLYDYFLSKGLCIFKGFIDDLKIYEKMDVSPNLSTELYREFTLRIICPKEQHACNKNLWYLSISYDGETEFTKKSLSDLGAINQSMISKILVKNKIKKFKFATDDEKNSKETKVLISNKIRSSLGLSLNIHRISNKYSKFYNEILSFYSGYLKGAQISDLLVVLESGFQLISKDQVTSVSSDSNLLVFGENQTHFNPYMGLKEYGPYMPIKEKDYKFFFIFHNEDKEYANRLYGYLTKGYKGYPGAFRFVGLNLNLDMEKTIQYKEKDPSQEILEKLNSFNFENTSDYLAIYISRIKKDDLDEQNRGIYYKVKKILLEKNISSQVVYKSNIDDPNFNYYLPNISIALLGKLGGVPWRLSRPIKHDLIIGLGAFREKENLYLGTTVAFKNDGTFLQFNTSKVNNTDSLISFFKDILNKLTIEQTEIKRVVIHFYKKMNLEEEKSIKRALDDLGLKVPYIVLNIVTDETTYIPFDLEYPGKLPSSGTCLTIRNGEYILCNNTRYASSTGSKIDDFPFPISIKISKASIGALTDDDVKQLVDQVYQFSRMYWVSVKQKGKPVTILYSEKVAKMSSFFEGQKLPESTVSTNTLWFL